MKRLNSYLLTHRPLLWNLRVHYIWPLILGIHALLFIWGYADARAPGIRRYDEISPSGELVTFNVLLALLGLVWWLLLFFRNNAFKSFYPLRKGRLAGEMALVFLTVLGLSTISLSFMAGKSLHIRQLAKSVDVEKEREIISLANHFLPYELNSFSRFNGCDTSVQQMTTDSAGVQADTFSYLHYCDFSYDYSRSTDGDFRRTRSPQTVRARGWLRQGERDSVLHILRQYLALVKKYHGKYVFDVEDHVASVFSQGDFELRYTISAVEVLASDASEEPVLEQVAVPQQHAPSLRYGRKTAYIERDNPVDALSLIESARGNLVPSEMAMLLGYLALGCTLLIFGFRLTELRAWFIALIGSGLWAIVIGLLLATVSRSSTQGAVVLVIVLELGFTVCAIIAPRSGWTRRWAGVVYLWSLWGMPFVLPVLWLLLEDITRPPYVSGIAFNAPSPFHQFLTAHTEAAMMLNILMCLLLLVFFYIPLARKLQAMAEE